MYRDSMAKWLLVPAFSALCALGAHASNSSEKIKAGLLPDGGQYAIYRVQCDGEQVAFTARMERRRWCSQAGSQLSCFSRPEEARLAACAAQGLAAADAATDAGSSESDG